MGELELSMGAMRARVDQIEPMVVDLTTTVKVRVKREETVVPQSPLLGLAPEDAVFRLPSGIGQLVPIQDVPRALGVEPFRDFGAEEERQVEEMERSGYQEANHSADLLVRAGNAPVPYSEDLPDGHVTISHNV